MSNYDILSAVVHKHDVAIAMTNGNRRFCLDLIEAGRAAERERIAAWLLRIGKRQIADAIEAEEHLK